MKALICIVLVWISTIIVENTEQSKFKKTHLLHGCTTFTIAQNELLLFARNLDVDSEYGYIVLNPRGVKKTAYLPKKSKEKAAQWVSKYGSVSFNQISLDIPHGGMNEAGLVVEHLYLEETSYPAPDNKPVMIAHQYIQFLLDNCANINEAVKTFDRVAISQTQYKFPIHFHLMDKNGNRAIIEFIDQKTKIYMSENYKIAALANTNYKNSLLYIENFEGWGGKARIPETATESDMRFVLAAESSKFFKYKKPMNEITYCFKQLDKVKNSTQWQLVYDLKHKRIHYRTKSNTNVKFIDLNKLDFVKLQIPKFIEINCEITYLNWVNYSVSHNKRLLETTCKNSAFINSKFEKEMNEIATNPIYF